MILAVQRNISQLVFLLMHSSKLPEVMNEVKTMRKKPGNIWAATYPQQWLRAIYLAVFFPSKFSIS